MPRVTQAESTVDVRPVSPGFQSTSGITTDAFGGRSARGMIEGGQQISGFSGDLAKVAIEQQRDDNERESKNLDIEYSSRLRDLGYGDGSPQNPGYYTLRGENALKEEKNYRDAMAKTRKEIEAKATNDRVRERFSTTSAIREDDELTRATKFVTRERETANDDASAARLGEAADDAANGWNNPETLERSLAIAEAEARSTGGRKGQNTEVTDAKVKEAQTVVLAAAIDAALESSTPSEARRIFEANKDKIGDVAATKIKKYLEAGTVREESQDAAASIQARHPGNIRAQIAAAKDIKDAKVQDETIQRLDNDFARETRLRNEAERETKRGAWQKVLEDKKLTPQELSVLDGTTISAMREFQRKQAQDGRGYADADDPEVQNELHNMFMQNRARFAKEDLMQYLPKLTEQALKYWQAQQRAVNSREEKDRAKFPGYEIANAEASVALQGMGIPPGTSKGEKGRVAEKIKSMARQVVDDLYEQEKMATREDIRKRLAELLLSGEIEKKNWINEDARRFEVLGTENEGAFVLTDIEEQKGRIAEAAGLPEGQVMAVVEALRKNKRPVTLENIKRVYDAAQEAARAR